MYDHAVLLGVIVSALFYELTSLSPGGLIVPGYLAMALHSPVRIVYTTAVALLSVVIVRALSRITILFGRRRFMVLILLSYLIHWLITSLNILPFPVSIIGCIIPGIIAHDIDRQGVVKTLLSLALVTTLLALILLSFGYSVFGT